MQLIYTSCLLFLSTFLLSQKPYFQQEVNYKIAVTLHDTSHTLIGDIAIEYKNNAPNRLDFIYLHLWANAYQNQNTAFARQQLRVGSTEFYFAKDADLGGFSNLNFTIDGQQAILELQKDNPDIAILRLPKPLESGQTITIQSPFTLKIPASFSRLGHVEKSYQMTQWFPKPAVYDNKGWHPMPCLDMGEFYSEFGNFDVTITLPNNYVVAATGVLQTEREKEFLKEQVEKTTAQLANLSNNSVSAVQEPFPASSSTLKTIHYTAENVHDFAWFADKRFQVQKSEVTLNSGKTVDTWVFFTQFEQQLWKDAVSYVNRSAKFYSDLVGEYAYPQATAVQSALSAGGGMEYPMITVIGASNTAKDLDIVITHEVGHNWFYGVLASNERDHAWMDEGINSYYEKRYTEQYYGKVDDLISLPNFIRKGSEMSLNELTYLWQARRNLDQAPETTSDDFTPPNYFLNAYEKPAVALQYLEAYLGKPAFDEAMQAYFQQWQFKHPQPTDFRKTLESNTNKNLTWLFNGLLYSNLKQDYAITNLAKAENYKVTITNKGDIAGPFTLSGSKNGKIVQSQWYEGFEGEQSVDFPEGDYDEIVIDAERITLDVNRKNNHIKTAGVFRKIEPLKLSFISAPENDKQTHLFWSPVFAWNNYDKFMLGLGFHNYGFPFKKFQFLAAPLYSFATKDIIGVADLQWHLYPKTTALQRVTLGLSGRMFHFDRNFQDGYYLKYARLVPSINFELGKKQASNFYQNIQWRTIWLNTQFSQRDDEGKYVGTNWDENFIHELNYLGENRRKLNPFSLNVILEQQSYNDIRGKQNYLKASLEWKSSFTYAEDKNFDVRIFGGAFLDNTRRKAGNVALGAFNLTSQGLNDYRFDDYYFGRRETEGIRSQQVTIREGGMKNVIGSGFSLGRSNNYIVALNFKTDLPMRLPLNLPLKPYFDIGYFDNAQPTGEEDTIKDQLLWSGGIMLEAIDDVFAIYFPLINSKNIQDRYKERGNYQTRITFTINLRKLNPVRLLERLEF